jgi:hypothetical protein
LQKRTHCFTREVFWQRPVYPQSDALYQALRAKTRFGLAPKN